MMILNKVKVSFWMTLFVAALLTGCSEDATEKNVLSLKTSENVVVESPYIYDGMLSVSNGKSGDKKRFGFMATNGELVVPTKYKATFPFSEGLDFVVNEAGAGAYINKKGESVILKVDNKAIVQGDIFKDGYAVVKLANEKGAYVIDQKGKVLVTPTDKKYYYKNLGGGLFERYLTSNTINPQGVVDASGKVKYNGKAMLITPTNEFNGFYTLDGNIYGVFDNKRFTTLTEPLFTDITKFVDSVAIVATKDGATQIIDVSGNVVANVSSQLSNIDDKKLNEFSDGVTALNFTDGTNSIIVDTKGNTVVKTAYDEVQAFHEGLAVCKKGSQYGYVNSAGVEIVKPIYETVTNINNGIGFVKKDGKWYRFTNK